MPLAQYSALWRPFMEQRAFPYLFSPLLLFPLAHVFGADIMEALNLTSAQGATQNDNGLIPHLFTKVHLNNPPLPVRLTAPVFPLDFFSSLLALLISVILATAFPWRPLLRSAQTPARGKQNTSLCRN